MKSKLPQTIEFYGVKITATKDVLFPRPETEFLVERADKIFSEKCKMQSAKLRALDMGTGSGAIVIPLAKKYPQGEFIGADLSSKALNVAEKNRKLNSLKNLKLIKSNLFANIPGRFDLIVANLPYVKTAELPQTNEPRMALDGGTHGLLLIEKFLIQAPNFLKKGGVILMEIGYDQGPELLKLAKIYLPKKTTTVEKDYGEHDRYVRIG